jgi:hypothetical protein
VSEPRANLVRALGVAGALGWVALALWTKDAWPFGGLVALAIALVAGLALRPIAAWVPRLLLAPPRAAFVGVCALAGAGISFWAVRHAMQDKPLSIDAGMYLLQGRALAHGHLGIATPHPMQAFDGRFLLEGPDGLLYGIFPPGWPLALAPFAAIGHPMFAGPFVAVLLVLAQTTLGGALGRYSGDEEAGEVATRASLLLSLASIGRALETADLLSHAFVAALAAFAVAFAIDLASGRRDGSTLRAAAAGACVGWVLASRLLDGVVLGCAIAGLLVWRRSGWRALGWAFAGALPFAALLLVEQRAATGEWLKPTQDLYFARCDWPPTCHRLGFGPDVGCTFEHPGPTARLGGDGYDVRDALAVTRERTGALGEDLLGWPPLLLVAFVPLVVCASAADAMAVALLLGLSIAYGLFYYGNALFFGARHLFPVAPFVWLLVARGVVLPVRSSHLRGAGIVAILAVAVWTVRAPWSRRVAEAADFQSPRSDVRRAMALNGVGRGIVKTHDLTVFATAFDPWDDGDRRMVAMDDNSGLLELRRAHPDLPLFLAIPGDNLGTMQVGRPPPGVTVELESAWPTFVRPSGLASKAAAQAGASGKNVLLVTHSTPGAQLEIRFETALAGDYKVRVDAFAGPSGGDYALELDGAPLAVLRGYASEDLAVRGEETSRPIPSGRHTLVARCLGRQSASTGYDARLDALVGEP